MFYLILRVVVDHQLLHKAVDTRHTIARWNTRTCTDKYQLLKRAPPRAYHKQQRYSYYHISGFK